MELNSTIHYMLDCFLLDPFIYPLKDAPSADDRNAFVAALHTPAGPDDTTVRNICLQIKAQLCDSALLDDIRMLSIQYRPCFDPTTDFAFMPTVAYTGAVEYSVVALVNLPAKAIITPLFGLLYSWIPPSTLSTAPRSIMNIKGADFELEGPVSRVNHRCTSANSAFHHLEPLGGLQQLCLITLRPVAKGEELTLDYGPNYFAQGECLCEHCASHNCNGWRDGPGATAIREGTRSSSLTAYKMKLGNTVFAYSAAVLPMPRFPGDYSHGLLEQSKKCLARHCLLRFAGFDESLFCGSCSERLRKPGQFDTTLSRYYAAVIGDPGFPGPHLMHDHLFRMSTFLRRLSLPGWKLFPRPVSFNSKLHKDHLALGEQTPDFELGTTCTAAIASGALQSGHIWLLTGIWRPDEANTITSVRDADKNGYTYIMMLRKQRVYIMDPCHVTEQATRTFRLTELRSLARARVMIDNLKKKRISVAGGIRIGCWRPVHQGDGPAMSTFNCAYFLQEMQDNQELQDNPDSWALEEIAR